MREKKYLDALIAAGFIAVKEYHYSILNSCVDFWHRFFYLNVERVITAPSDAGSEILSQFDEFALEKHLPECMPLRVSPLLSALYLIFEENCDIMNIADLHIYQYNKEYNAA